MRLAACLAAFSPRLRNTRRNAPASPRTLAAATPDVSTAWTWSSEADAPPRRPGRRGRPAHARAARVRRPGRAPAGPRQGAESAVVRPAPHRRAPGRSSGSGWASSTSAYWRMIVIGERSSCDASDTKRRWLFRAYSNLSSIRFIVAASRPISSLALGCGTRRCSCTAEISSTSRRIASTGARARPTANQVVSPTTATITGTPMINNRVSTVVVSSTSTSARAGARGPHQDGARRACCSSAPQRFLSAALPWWRNHRTTDRPAGTGRRAAHAHMSPSLLFVDTGVGVVLPAGQVRRPRHICQWRCRSEAQGSSVR